MLCFVNICFEKLNFQIWLSLIRQNTWPESVSRDDPYRACICYWELLFHSCVGLRVWMADCWYAKPARKGKRSVGVCSCICFVFKGWLPEGKVDLINCGWVRNFLASAYINAVGEIEVSLYPNKPNKFIWQSQGTMYLSNLLTWTLWIECVKTYSFCIAVISVPSSLFVLVLKPKKFSMMFHLMIHLMQRGKKRWGSSWQILFWLNFNIKFWKSKCWGKML